MPQIGYAHRQAPMGRRGMVASCHPLASLAGVDVLRAGGNVVDAAIATNAVLAVTQPNFCGVGGDIFVLYHEAATGRVHFLNGAGRSGARATLDELARRGLECGARPPARARSRCPASRAAGACSWIASEPARSPRCWSRPRTTRARASRSPTWSRRPYARRPPRWTIRSGTGCSRPAGCSRPPARASASRTWPARLTELGPEPDLFYKGRVARSIAERMRVDGFLTAEDLAAHEGEWAEPISSIYRGYRVYETPPPTQGLAALLTLNLLEGFDVAKHEPQSPEHLHLLIEMTKLAYADRDRWIADPDHERVPVEALLSKAYAERRRRVFDPGKAQWHRWGEIDGDTTGFVVADGRGNVVSVIQSLYKAFGSTVVAPGTGVVLQNRGAYFNCDPAHPNCFAPGKRPFHTLIACVVTRDERPVLGYSNMGGDGQAMFHTQSLTNALDYGMEIQEAIERPRFVAGPIDPGDVEDQVRIEGRVPEATRAALERKGHNVTPVSNFFMRMGHAHGISLADGTLRGGADPRGDGAAIGF